jgi:excisionase family DNA binding protein
MKPPFRTPADTEKVSTGADSIKVISADRAALWSRVAKLTLLTTDEASLYCRVGLRTFERMVKDIPIAFVRPAGPNGDRRFFRTDLDAALLSRRENAAPAA